MILHGAIIELFENNRLISIKYPDNLLNFIKEIERETLLDIERELEG